MCPRHGHQMGKSRGFELLVAARLLDGRAITADEGLQQTRLSSPVALDHLDRAASQPPQRSSIGHRRDLARRQRARKTVVPPALPIRLARRLQRRLDAQRRPAQEARALVGQIQSHGHGATEGIHRPGIGPPSEVGRLRVRCQGAPPRALAADEGSHGVLEGPSRQGHGCCAHHHGQQDHQNRRHGATAQAPQDKRPGSGQRSDHKH